MEVDSGNRQKEQTVRRKDPAMTGEMVVTDTYLPSNFT